MDMIREAMVRLVMTAQHRHIVFRTDKPDATEVDIERWLAQRGAIVATSRLPADVAIEFNGKTGGRASIASSGPATSSSARGSK